MRRRLLALGLAASIGAATVASAWALTVFNFYTALTGNEVIADQGNPTGASYTSALLRGQINGVSNQTGTTYAFLGTGTGLPKAVADAGELITFSNTAAIAVTLPQAGTTGFAAGVCWQVEDINTGTATITPTVSTINGASTLALAQGVGAAICSDGTNYQIQAGGAASASVPTTGTSGGVPYYSSTTTLASSALLTNHGVIVGGGAGAAPAALSVGATGALLQGSTGANPSFATTLSGAYTFSGATETFSGQIVSTAGLPTIASGACGATTNGAVVAASTNQTGNITIGAATTTTCTVSFSATLGVTPNACVIFPTNATAAATGTTVARVSSVTSSQFVITGSALASANYEYICL